MMVRDVTLKDISASSPSMSPFDDAGMSPLGTRPEACRTIQGNKVEEVEEPRGGRSQGNVTLGESPADSRVRVRARATRTRVTSQPKSLYLTHGN